MGEAKRGSKAGRVEISKAIGVETAGGKVQVRWDNKSEATPFGQMVFFIEFFDDDRTVVVVGRRMSVGISEPQRIEQA